MNLRRVSSASRARRESSISRRLYWSQILHPTEQPTRRQPCSAHPDPERLGQIRATHEELALNSRASGEQDRRRKLRDRTPRAAIREEQTATFRPGFERFAQRGVAEQPSRRRVDYAGAPAIAQYDDTFAERVQYCLQVIVAIHRRGCYLYFATELATSQPGDSRITASKR
jgi:hypothetical protein